MAKRTIILDDQQDAWASAQIAAGRYADIDELVADALEEMRIQAWEHENREAIGAKLDKALNSGSARAWTKEEFLKHVKSGSG